MRQDETFEWAVGQFLDALMDGENIDPTWEELLEMGFIEADLQRALQRAEVLEAEAEGWDG